jgi:acetylornithine deacetylase/succinyl-diaminopimelate desuccinylase-like protein
MAPAGAWLPPISADPDSPFVRAVLRAVDASEPGPTFIGATDAPYLVRAGIPTVILGAGSVTVAHSDHEYVEIDALKAAVGIYERVARALLVDTGRRFEERTEWDISAIRESVGAARDPAESQPE